MTSARCTWQEPEADAIQVLTRAAHEATRGTQDFTDFLVRVLASTAANVGPQQLGTGPSDSPAVHHVRALLQGANWDVLDQWLPHRTQPVVITVNVAQIIESGLHPELLGLTAAIDKIAERYALLGSAETHRDQRTTIDAIAARYRDEYRSYADRFGVAAQAAGAEHGLRAGVYVTADVDPCSAWRSETAITNPRDGSGDRVAYILWKFAHDAVAPPDVALVDAPMADLRHATRRV